MPKRKHAKRPTKAPEPVPAPPVEPPVAIPEPVGPTEAEMREAIDRLNTPSDEAVRAVDEEIAGMGWLIVWAALAIVVIGLIAHFHAQHAA